MVNLFIGNLYDACEVTTEVNPYIRIYYRDKKCKHTNNMLENGLMNLYKTSPFNVINASYIYIYICEFDNACITCKIHFTF